MKPSLPSVTLLAVDTTDRVELAERAIEKSMAQCNFGAVKLLTDKPRARAVRIRTLSGIDDYSRFCVRELHQYFDTSHCLVIQHDGYVVNGAAWDPIFLKCDYLGAPWEQDKRVGNGGFSLRSRRLCKAAADIAPHESGHPEDHWLCRVHRGELERQGMVWGPINLARKFAFEGRLFNGKEWDGVPLAHTGQFGFHSWLTPLPKVDDRPLIFHHSGDLGDVIYALPVVKLLGGGVLFISPNNKYPFPRPTRYAQKGYGAAPEFMESLGPLLARQDYVWQCLQTQLTPFSVDVDLNAFRRGYQSPGAPNWESILGLHLRAFNLRYDPDIPWLQCDEPVTLPYGRDIIVNRTVRYHNERFPWGALVAKYHNRMAFVGMAEEYGIWRGFGPEHPIPHLPTQNLWDVARVIKGAKVFIGNQSSPLAVAHGLGAKVLVEVWKQNANCNLKREDAIYCDGDRADIPESWLRC